MEMETRDAFNEKGEKVSEVSFPVGTSELKWANALSAYILIVQEEQEINET